MHSVCEILDNTRVSTLALLLIYVAHKLVEKNGMEGFDGVNNRMVRGGFWLVGDFALETIVDSLF